MNGEAKLPALSGECDCCGAPDGVLTMSTIREYHCPKCAAEFAIGAQANQHLEQLVLVVLEAWVQTWGIKWRCQALTELELVLGRLENQERKKK